MKFYIGSSFKNCELVNYFSEKLEANEWQHTYNWAKNINDSETIADMLEYAMLEKNAIATSDIVIILLPGGKATHIEIGMALALNKKIFLCTNNKDDFNIENTIIFYELPNIVKLVGTNDEILESIIMRNKI